MSDSSAKPTGPGSADSSEGAGIVGRPRRRSNRLRRTLIILGATIVLVATAVGVGGALLIQRYDHAVSRGELLAPGSRSHNASVSGPLNLLLIGSDKRVGNPDAGERSDTIIVAHVSRALNKVYLISVPRDLLVDIPPMPSINFAGDTTKINAAFEYGKGGPAGTQLVSATLTKLMGTRFDGAAVIDFSGLRSAVDILNGVNMCVDTRVVSIHTGKVFEPGCRLMGSGDVLDYLRQRDFPDGDYSRQRHQQQFLKAFLERARSTGAASNPVKMDALLRAVAGTMTVDTGETKLTDLVFSMRQLGPTNMMGVKIPSDPDTIDDVSYVVASPDAPGLFDAIRKDRVEEWTKNNQQWVNKI
jgi:LCP family protein required for cell wall assembly